MTKKNFLNLPANPNIRKILIIKWSAMGDVVLASAIFEDVHAAFPNAEIDLNTLPTWEKLYQADPRFKEIISIDIRKKGQQIKVIREWLKRIGSKRYDLIIDLQSTDRSRILITLLMLLGKAPQYRMGNNPEFPYTIRPKTKPAHALDIYQTVIAMAGIPVKSSRPILHIPTTNQANAKRLLEQHNLEKKTFAVFLPGCQAAGHLKRWGSKNYAQLAQLLHKQGINHILLIGGPDEIEECQKIQSICGEYCINLCGQTEILDIVPLCDQAKFIVSNDTGTGHIAAATKTPMVVIFGPTNPLRHKPAGDNVAALQASEDQLDCLNCYQKECSHHSCMRLISPDMVYQNLIKLST